MTESAKRACKRIGTHDGTFHCDEVLACYLLRKLPEFFEADIVRYTYRITIMYLFYTKNSYREIYCVTVDQ